MANIVQRCLTKENPSQWIIRRICMKTIGDLLQSAMLLPSHDQEGKILDLDEAIVIGDMTQITLKKSTQWTQNPPIQYQETNHSETSNLYTLNPKCIYPLTTHSWRNSTPSQHQPTKTESEMLLPSHDQEGKILDLDEAIVISDMTQITFKKSTEWIF